MTVPLLGAVKIGTTEGNGLVTNNNRFGDPARSDTTSFVELAISAAATFAGLAFGFPVKYKAAAPVTCGAAMDVPSQASYEFVEVMVEEVIAEPGAKISRQVP